jgi:hypothetical protein
MDVIMGVSFYNRSGQGSFDYMGEEDAILCLTKDRIFFPLFCLKNPALFSAIYFLGCPAK